jgi:hypothetical protein
VLRLWCLHIGLLPCFHFPNLIALSKQNISAVRSRRASFQQLGPNLVLGLNADRPRRVRFHMHPHPYHPTHTHARARAATATHPVLYIGIHCMSPSPPTLSTRCQQSQRRTNVEPTCLTSSRYFLCLLTRPPNVALLTPRCARSARPRHPLHPLRSPVSLTRLTRPPHSPASL